MADKKILVVVDPTASEHPCVDHAAWLAECVSADLELFICDYDPNIAAGRTSTVWVNQDPNETRNNLMAILRDKLERQAGTLRKRHLNVTVDVAWDHPLVDGIVRKVLASKPWLVVKDTHHHGVLKRTILSNTDWGLIRDCPAPLYLVQPTAVREKPKVFAAIDPLHEHDKPADLDHQIFRLAKTLADGSGGELHAVHTYALPVPMGGPEAAPSADLLQAVEQEHRQAMLDFLAVHELPKGHAHLLEGAPQDRLPDVVEQEGVDVMVMGAVSRSGLKRIFIGSTAERVLDRLACDVVIVKPAGFEPPDG